MAATWLTTKVVDRGYHRRTNPRRTHHGSPTLGAYRWGMELEGYGATAAVVSTFLAGLDGEVRQVSECEWGLTLDAAGWPLHLGMSIGDGLLRAQAEVVEAGQIDSDRLLRWNRNLPLVRFSQAGSGAIWVQGDLPLEAVDSERLDGFLGLLVRVATQAREAAASS